MAHAAGFKEDVQSQCYILYAGFFLVKEGFLLWDAGTDMLPVLALLNKERSGVAVTHILSLINYDFSWLMEPRFDYAEYEEIPSEQIQALTACTIHYGLDLGSVARY